MTVEGSTAGVAAPSARARHEALDSARMLATLGVVWTHVTEVQGQSYGSSALGRFGTSYYILLAVYFSMRSRVSRPSEPLSRVFRVRLRRLMLPYLLWSIVYGALYIRYGVSIGSSFSEIAQWWGPLAGTARHLWFLPFAVFAGAVASFVTPWLLTLKTSILCACFVLGSLGWYWLFDGVIFFALDRPWELALHLHRLDRWIEEVPLVLSATTGIALFYRFRRDFPRASLRFAPRGLSAALAMVGFGLVEWFYYEKAEALRVISGGETRIVAHAAGSLLFVAALLATEIGWVRWWARLAKHNYFVFLAHVIVLDGLSTPLSRMPGFGTPLFCVACTLGIYVVCALAGPVVRRVPVLRYLYPGL